MEKYTGEDVTSFLMQKAGIKITTNEMNPKLTKLFTSLPTNHPVFYQPTQNSDTGPETSSKIKGKDRKGRDKMVVELRQGSFKQPYTRNFEEEEKEIDVVLKEEDGEDDDDDDDDDERLMEDASASNNGKLSHEGSSPIERNNRTVFVGNIPKEYNANQIKNFFKVCGDIETVRIRSVAPSRDDLPKGVIAKTKDFHPQRNSFNAYVVFKSKESVSEAIQKNGKVLGGHHLRVDTTSSDTKRYSNRKSVFVGNLPFDVEEENLRHFMSDCGEIEAIRLIRDKNTGLGKGCGFVLFEDPASVMLALKLNSQRFAGRKIRISQAMAQGKKQRETEGNAKKGFNQSDDLRKGPSKKRIKKLNKKKWGKKTDQNDNWVQQKESSSDQPSLPRTNLSETKSGNPSGGFQKRGNQSRGFKKSDNQITGFKKKSFSPGFKKSDHQFTGLKKNNFSPGFKKSDNQSPVFRNKGQKRTFPSPGRTLGGSVQFSGKKTKFDD